MLVISDFQGVILLIFFWMRRYEQSSTMAATTKNLFARWLRIDHSPRKSTKKQLDAATPGESHEHPSGMACLSCLCQMICQVPGCGISGFLPWTFSKKQDTSMYIYIYCVYIYIYIQYTYIPYIPYIPWKVKLVYLINKLEFCRKKTLGQCLEFSLRSTVTAVTSKL